LGRLWPYLKYNASEKSRNRTTNTLAYLSEACGDEEEKSSDIESKSEMGKKKEENKQVFIYVSHL
jgi:hypothetical protein